MIDYFIWIIFKKCILKYGFPKAKEYIVNNYKNFNITTLIFYYKQYFPNNDEGIELESL